MENFIFCAVSLSKIQIYENGLMKAMVKEFFRRYSSVQGFPNPRRGVGE